VGGAACGSNVPQSGHSGGGGGGGGYKTWNVCFDGREGVTNHKMFWFSLRILSESPILRKILRHTTIKAHSSSCKELLFLSNFNETLISSTDLREIFKYQISWKSVQWKPNCSMRTVIRVAIRKFRVAPKNSHKNLSQCHFAHHKSYTG
jgi:hypothetical protein